MSKPRSGYCQTRDLTQDEWFELYQKTVKELADAKKMWADEFAKRGQETAALVTRLQNDLQRTRVELNHYWQASDYAEEVVAENKQLRAVVQRLLDDSWNGPIDADHPARAMGADALAAKNGSPPPARITE